MAEASINTRGTPSRYDGSTTQCAAAMAGLTSVVAPRYSTTLARSGLHLRGGNRAGIALAERTNWKRACG